MVCPSWSCMDLSDFTGNHVVARAAPYRNHLYDQSTQR